MNNTRLKKGFRILPVLPAVVKKRGGHPMTAFLFSTIIVFSSAVAKLVAVPFWRRLLRHPELLPGVPAVFAAVAGSLFFAAGRYPPAGIGPVHFLFALALDLTGWGVWILLDRRERQGESA